MKLIYKDFCPICNLSMTSSDGEEFLVSYLMHYYCPEWHYRVYIDSPTEFHVIINLQEEYIIQYVLCNDDVETCWVNDLTGNELFRIKTKLPINFKNPKETIDKIKSLLVFT